MTSLMDSILARYKQECRIHSVQFEITHRCPCRCDHCFLVKNTAGEMTTAEVLDLLDQLKTEGVLNLTITGGDPLVREDMETILARARDEGFLVYLMTTGYLIDEEKVRMLQRTGVKKVELSLHGVDASVHDGVMGVKGSFVRMEKAARLMVAAGILVNFKATITRRNYRQLHDLERFAGDLGGTFEALASVMPRTDGDMGPLDIALTEDQVAGLDPRLLNGGIVPGEQGAPGVMIKCNAGVTVAGISPRGEVYPCIIFRQSLGNIRDRSLADIWHDHPADFLTRWRSLQEEEAAECLSCPDRDYCRRCPGSAFLETGQLTAAQPSACSLARGLKRAWANLGESPGRD